MKIGKNSPFKANAILDAVCKVYSSYFETTGNLKPGQILFQVISIDTSSNTHLKDSKQTMVTLTLDAGEEDLEIGVVSLVEEGFDTHTIAFYLIPDYSMTWDLASLIKQHFYVKCLLKKSLSLMLPESVVIRKEQLIIT